MDFGLFFLFYFSNAANIRFNLIAGHFIIWGVKCEESGVRSSERTIHSWHLF